MRAHLPCASAGRSIKAQCGELTPLPRLTPTVCALHDFCSYLTRKSRFRTVNRNARSLAVLATMCVGVCSLGTNLGRSVHSSPRARSHSHVESCPHLCPYGKYNVDVSMEACCHYSQHWSYAMKSAAHSKTRELCTNATPRMNNEEPQ